MQGEELSNVRQLRRNWPLPICALLFFATGFAFYEYGHLRDNVWEPLGVLAMWLGGFFAALVVWRNAFRLERTARLVASPAAFQLNGGRPIPVEDIVEARVFPEALRGARDVVELKVRTGKEWPFHRSTLWIALMPKDARRFVELLGTRGGERRATFAIAFPFAHRFWAAMVIFGVPWLTLVLSDVRGDQLGAIVIGIIVSIAFVIAPFCAVIALVVGVFLRGRLVIGAEGFTTHWYGVRRYRSFGTVSAITIEDRARSSGKIVDTIVEGAEGRKRKRIIAHDRPDTAAERGAESRALAHTMEAAFDRWRKMPAVEKASAQLERGGRTVKDWLAGIDHLVHAAGSYRDAPPISADTLTEVARASDVSTAARVGAAAALLRIEGGAHRAVVRIAAEACVEPATRAALLELVDANEDETKMRAVLERVR